MRARVAAVAAVALCGCCSTQTQLLHSCYAQRSPPLVNLMMRHSAVSVLSSANHAFAKRAIYPPLCVHRPRYVPLYMCVLLYMCVPLYVCTALPSDHTFLCLRRPTWPPS